MTASEGQGRVWGGEGGKRGRRKGWGMEKQDIELKQYEQDLGEKQLVIDILKC